MEKEKVLLGTFYSFPIWLEIPKDVDAAWILAQWKEYMAELKAAAEEGRKTDVQRWFEKRWAKQK